MNKHYIIALYILVATNFLSLVWMMSDVNRALFNFTKDYTEHVSIVDSHISKVGENQYLNMKVINEGKVRVRDFNILVTVSDTNDIHLCSLEQSYYITILPQKERNISFELEYPIKNNLEAYKLEPSIGGAEAF